MENVTKALLIAAGVLIAIILIAMGIKILGSSNNTADSVEEVGEQLSGALDKYQERLEGEMLASDNLVNLPNDTYKVVNKPYQEIRPTNPTVVLKENTKYVLSFDYKIRNKTNKIYCTVLYGNTIEPLYDIKYCGYGDSSNEGNVKVTFTTPEKFETSRWGKTIDTPYFWIRFIRFYGDVYDESAEVEISNVVLKRYYRNSQ